MLHWYHAGVGNGQDRPAAPRPGCGRSCAAVNRLLKFDFVLFPTYPTDIKDTMATIEQRLTDLEKRVETLERSLVAPSSTVASGRKTLSPKEFILSRTASGAIETTFLLCCYAERVQGAESFGVADIEELFRAARLPVPSNINDCINKNIAKGYITEAKDKKNGKKAWVVTLTGEQTFEAGAKK